MKYNKQELSNSFTIPFQYTMVLSIQQNRFHRILDISFIFLNTDENNQLMFQKRQYSQTCVQRPPLGLKKVAIFQKWLWSLKITINLETLGITLAVVERWPLFRGGC
jgi:hypothetical protein